MARIVDKAYHRKMISYRTAVHTIEQIADELLKYGSSGFYDNPYYFDKPFDKSVNDMVEKIKILKIKAKKYDEIKSFFKELIQ